MKFWLKVNWPMLTDKEQGEVLEVLEDTERILRDD